MTAAPPGLVDHRLQQTYLVQPSVLEALHTTAGSLGIPVCEDVVTLEMQALELLGILDECGGTWKPVTGWREWDIHLVPPSDLLADRLRRISRDFVLPAQDSPTLGVMGLGGIVTILWEGERFLLAEVKVPRRDSGLAQVAAVVGRSRDTSLKLIAAILGRAAVQRRRIRVWGGALQFVDLVSVQEDEIILPEGLKSSLLGYVDRFWLLRARAAELGISGRRGILLVGPPGCGKTLFVRHLLTRLPDARPHLFLAERVAGPASPFSDMLDSVRRSSAASIVVLEDLDRLTESGVVTKEFLLNALDGMLVTGNWVLWVATSNDPRGLEENLLDRPGRFDRVVIFPTPGECERRELVRLYSPFELDEPSLDRATKDADGLTGAHIREACHAAALEVIETNRAYGPMLMREIQRMREQHERARNHDFELSRRRAGF